LVVSLDYVVLLLGAWPCARTPDRNRSRSQFKTIESRVLAHVERELKHLDGRQVVFRLQVREQDIRQDGMLRANARPSDPGVILEFTARRLKDSPRLLYRCDTFRNWWDNLSAIARALEALRMVDRYGVTPTGEQYAGFKALPSPTAATMPTEAAAAIIADVAGRSSYDVLQSVEVARDAVRIARSRSHPDRGAEQRGDFTTVEAARSVLSSHHGVSL
jgi:hypothetical protein